MLYNWPVIDSFDALLLFQRNVGDAIDPVSGFRLAWLAESRWRPNSDSAPSPYWQGRREVREAIARRALSGACLVLPRTWLLRPVPYEDLALATSAKFVAIPRYDGRVILKAIREADGTPRVLFADGQDETTIFSLAYLPEAI